MRSLRRRAPSGVVLIAAVLGACGGNDRAGGGGPADASPDADASVGGAGGSAGSSSGGSAGSNTGGSAGSNTGGSAGSNTGGSAGSSNTGGAGQPDGGGTEGGVGADAGTATACSVPGGVFAAAVAAEPPVGYTVSGATTCPAGRSPAFPGAEGFGACATGGRGGRVIQVTNLNASGPGSLKDAVDQAGPRIVVFRVSGIIDATLEITHGDLTIAGQTSPGGITVRGILCASYGNTNPTGECDNVAIRHLRSRPSRETVRATTGGLLLDDGLRLDGASDVIIDHVSIAHGVDESIQMARASRITIQNSMLSELIDPDHYWGTGMLINYSSTAHPLNDLSFHHNVWNRQESRLPEISCEDSADDGPSSCGGGRRLRLELSNNLLFDPGFPITYGPPETGDVVNGTFLDLNWVGNSSFARADYTYGVMYENVVTTPDNRNFLDDNRFNLEPSFSDVELLSCCNDYNLYGGLSGSHPSLITTRHPFPVITYHSSTQLASYAVRYAGAFPRDPMDRRLLHPIALRAIATQGGLSSRMGDPCGDAFDVDASTGALPADGDADGMADAWEATHGLDSGKDDSTGLTVGLGRGIADLTNVEVYLHDLHLQRIGAAP